MKQDREAAVRATVGLVILILLGAWAYNAWFKSEKWIGLYELPTTNQIQVGGHFDSKESCFAWLLSQEVKKDGRYNFECGKNCTPPSTVTGVYRCDETVN